MIWHVSVGGATRTIERTPDGWRLDGRVVAAHLTRDPASAELVLHLDGLAIPLGLDGHGPGGWRLVHEGTLHEVRVEDERTRELRARAPIPAGAGGPALLKAPMPGLVVRVLVHDGEHVAAGAGLVVLEAMKMENELKAPRAGLVGGLRVAAGQTVEKGAVLLEVGEG